jgi:putative transposase
MSRPLRIQYPNAWYHVMNRGRRGEHVFESKHDYQLFIKILKETVELFALRVSAYCLMPNHYHLLVQTPDSNLSRCMRHLNGVYTQRYNSSHGFDGQLFRGRFKAILVAEDSYLLQLVRYVHRNPVRAGMATKAEDYEWSSHRGYLSKATGWKWLHKAFILSMLADGPGNYRAFMGEDDDEGLLRVLRLNKMPSILGDSPIVDKLKSKLFRVKRDLEVPESKQLAPDMERIKMVICAYYCIDEEQLCFSRRAVFNEARDMGLYFSRYLRGETLEKIGEHFGIARYSTVSSAIARFMDRLQADRRLSRRVEQVRQAIVSQGQI